MRSEGTATRQVAETGDDRQAATRSRFRKTASSSKPGRSRQNLVSRPEILWQEIERGIVHGVVERGEGGDAGRREADLPLSHSLLSMTLEDMPS